MNRAVHSESETHQSRSGLQVPVDLGAERDRLTARLAEIRNQRLSDEAEARQLPQLLRAIVLARTDRDRGISRRLRAHRDHLERVFADAEELVLATVQITVMIHVLGLDEADPIVHAARQAVLRARDAVDHFSKATEEAWS